MNIWNEQWPLNFQCKMSLLFGSIWTTNKISLGVFSCKRLLGFDWGSVVVGWCLMPICVFADKITHTHTAVDWCSVFAKVFFFSFQWMSTFVPCSKLVINVLCFLVKRVFFVVFFPLSISLSTADSRVKALTFWYTFEPFKFRRDTLCLKKETTTNHEWMFWCCHGGLAILTNYFLYSFLTHNLWHCTFFW